MGNFFKVPGYALGFIGGLWSLFICLGIVHDLVGTLGMIIAFMVLPATLSLAPFYAGFAQHNWFPLIVTYGSGLGAGILIMIGTALDNKNN